LKNEKKFGENSEKNFFIDMACANWYDLLPRDGKIMDKLK